MHKNEKAERSPKPDPEFLTSERSKLVDRIAARATPIKVPAVRKP